MNPNIGFCCPTDDPLDLGTRHDQCYTEDGDAAMIDGLLFDVTEQHRLKEELVEREAAICDARRISTAIMFPARNARRRSWKLQSWN